MQVFLGENAAELATGSGKVVLERLREVDTLSQSLCLSLPLSLSLSLSLPN